MAGSSERIVAATVAWRDRRLKPQSAPGHDGCEGRSDGGIAGQAVAAPGGFAAADGQGQLCRRRKRPGMLVAVLVRSPHAHADVARHRHRRGARHARRGGRVHPGRPDRCRPAPGRHRLSAPGWRARRRRPTARCSPRDRVRFVGEPVALVVAETARRGAGGRGGGRRGLPGTARGDRSGRGDAARRADGVGRGARQYRLPVEARRRGAHRAGAARRGACDEAAILRLPRHRQLDGAARRLGGDRRRTGGWCCTPRSSRRSAAQWPGAEQLHIWSRRISACCPAMSAARSA